MARKTGAGRIGGVGEARELVSLVATLSEAGDALTAQAVAERLGTTPERAQKLIDLVLTSTAGGGQGLPLIVDPESGEVTLTFSGGLAGRRLRLTRGETLAVDAALDLVGVTDDDPLRATLAPTLSAEPASIDVMGADAAESEVIRRAAEARLTHRELVFLYRKPASQAAEKRRVVVRAARHEDGSWFLDGWDTERAAARTFRMDRMSDAVLGDAASAPAAAEETAHAARQVRLTFSDPSYLRLLDWHGLGELHQNDDGTLWATIPDFGGDWLVRMVAACAGTVTADDKGLMQRVRAHAEALLA